MDVDLRRLAEAYELLWDVKRTGRIGGQALPSRSGRPQPAARARTGPAGVRQVIVLYHRVFHNLTLTFEDIVTAGDKVAVRWTAHGTHAGDQLGVPGHAPEGDAHRDRHSAYRGWPDRRTMGRSQRSRNDATDSAAIEGSRRVQRVLSARLGIHSVKRTQALKSGSSKLAAISAWLASAKPASPRRISARPTRSSQTPRRCVLGLMAVGCRVGAFEAARLDSTTTGQIPLPLRATCSPC